jgi:hypothetical protein
MKRGFLAAPPVSEAVGAALGQQGATNMPRHILAEVHISRSDRSEITVVDIYLFKRWCISFMWHLAFAVARERKGMIEPIVYLRSPKMQEEVSQ